MGFTGRGGPLVEAGSQINTQVGGQTNPTQLFRPLQRTYGMLKHAPCPAYVYIWCVCVYMSGPHRSGFHHRGPLASRNHVIRHVNAVITHHYPEVQVLVTPFSPAFPPTVEADVHHLFTASEREINTEGLNLKG